MTRRRKLIVAIAALFAVPVIGVVAAESLGIDTGLVIDRILTAVGKESPDAQPEAEGQAAAPPPERMAARQEDSAVTSPGPDGHGLPVKEPMPDKDAPAEDVLKGDRPVGELADESPGADYFRLPEGDGQPWKQYRKLQRLQDGIVVGKPDALRAYRLAMSNMSTALLAQPDEYWKHPRNVLSAAAFVMAGGKPVVARKLLGTELIGNGPPARLLKAAYTFSSGDYYRAYNLFYDIDPMRLPPSIGGQVALVRAMLSSPRDPEQAAHYLLMARRIAPGTLVDEAATRRHLQVLSELNDTDGFFATSQTYMRRFPNSLYLADFLRNYSTGILKQEKYDDETVVQHLRPVTAMIDENASLYLYTLLARGATVYGRLELARAASELSLVLANPDSRLAERLKLYHAAASLRSDTEFASEALSRMDGLHLGKEDRRLLAAARLVARQIRGTGDEGIWPGEAGEPSLVGLPSGLPVDAEADNALAMEARETLPILAQIDGAFRQADELMDW